MWWSLHKIPSATTVAYKWINYWIRSKIPNGGNVETVSSLLHDAHSHSHSYCQAIETALLNLPHSQTLVKSSVHAIDKHPENGLILDPNGSSSWLPAHWTLQWYGCIIGENGHTSWIKTARAQMRSCFAYELLCAECTKRPNCWNNRKEIEMVLARVQWQTLW